jgi:anhydro-N-acetylmuramic acid kinase
MAARGNPVEKVVDEILRHAFFAAKPPKSTGREIFGDELAMMLRERVQNGDDCVATATRLTVRSIAEQLGRWLPHPRPLSPSLRSGQAPSLRSGQRLAGEGGVDPSGDRDELLVSGGGARNRTLMSWLSAALPDWSVRQFSDVFFDGDAKEAVAFALIGWLTLAGQPGNVPSATGAKGPRVLGRITPA